MAPSSFHTLAAPLRLYTSALSGAATSLLILALALPPSSSRGEELRLTPSARHNSATLADEYLALQREIKLLNRAFYHIGTSIHAYATPRCPEKCLMKLDERILTLHAAVLLREKPPARLRRELASILKELSRWRITTEVAVTQLGVAP